MAVPTNCGTLGPRPLERGVPLTLYKHVPPPRGLSFTVPNLIAVDQTVRAYVWRSAGKTRPCVLSIYLSIYLSIHLSIYLKSQDYGDVSAGAQQGRLTMS